MLVWLNEHATFANENWMNKNVKTCWFGSMSQKWFRLGIFPSLKNTLFLIG
jgi:hypothetical protein